MSKLLGLDIGQKRIGVALAEGKIATTFGIIKNTGLKEAIQQIGEICRQEQIEKIIIGIPKNQDTFQADQIHKFALELTKSLSIEIDYIDETLTSKEASRILEKVKIDPRSEKYRREVDKLSAKLILESYLSRARC